MSKTPFDTFDEQPIPKGMSHWRNGFDSRYLRYFALNGKPRIVTITAVGFLKSSNKRESKTQLLITLAEFEKKWAINVTNCQIIENLYNEPDPNKWIGLRLELYETTTRLPDGNEGPCIRVRPRIPAAGAKTEKPRHRQEVAQYLDEMKRATGLSDLGPIVTRIGDDTELTRDEAAFLLEAFAKRQGQLTPGSEAAQ
jgi:hypothetical protein